MQYSNISPVMIWAENAVALEQDFLPMVVEALEQWANGNRTDLSILLCVTHGIKTDLVKTLEKNRLPFAAPLKKIIGIVLPGLDYKANKNKASGVSYSMDLDAQDVDYDVSEALGHLVDMASEGVLYKHKDFKDWAIAFGPMKVVRNKTTSESRTAAQKAAPKMLKAANSNGHITLEYAMAYQAELTNIIAKLQHAAEAEADDLIDDTVVAIAAE